jgi:hypothetical protein
MKFALWVLHESDGVPLMEWKRNLNIEWISSASALQFTYDGTGIIMKH